MMNMRDETKSTNDFLCVIDASYFRYFIAFGAVSKFQKDFLEEASVWIKPPEECDQKNLPNLLNCDTFKQILVKQTMKRLETVDYIAKANFQDELDCADKIDIVFAMDDRLKNNFRLALYPAYKGQRKLIKRSYNVFAITDYITDIIFKDLDVENRYGYHFVKVPGAEGDDVIATTLMNFKDRYATTMLIASDRDFLQIEGVREFDMLGREVKRTLGDQEVTADEFLLGKILMGDKSDNISQVFKKCGPKTALKLVKDKAELRKRLNESQDASKQFLLNKKIISFKEIPKELTDAIIEKVNIEVYDRRAKNAGTSLSDFMSW